MKRRILLISLLTLLLLTRGGPADAPHPTQAESTAPPRSCLSNWTVEQIERGRDFSKMEDHNIALDSGGHPHVAYGERELYYAWHDGTTWHRETVDPSLMVGTYATLGLDGADLPHIAYFDDGGGNLKYAHYDGASWQVLTVDVVVGWG